jgi:malate dehydrogenase (oxaloacetate-decarboxylating)(NADP+)
VTPADLEQGSLFPPLSNTREVSAQIAVAVAEVAFERGLASKSRPEDMLSLVRAHVYDPHYPAYI